MGLRLLEGCSFLSCCWERTVELFLIFLDRGGWLRESVVLLKILFLSCFLISFIYCGDIISDCV